MKIAARIEKAKDFWFLLIVSSFFFVLRLPSLFEPYWYSDEGIYQVLGMAIRKGGLLYRDIWDNKPPLLYLIYAVFDGDQFYVRLFFLIIGLFSVLAFFYLAKKIFAPPESNQKKIYFITSLFAFLFATPLLEGNIANAENLMMLPIIMAALLVLKNKLFPAGLLLGIAFVIKIVAIFDLGAFLTFFFIISFEKDFDFKFVKNLARKMMPLALGFFIPFFLIILYFFLNNALGDFLNAAFFQMAGYVGYGNQLIIPQGFLILKLLFLSGFCFFIFRKRSLFDKNLIFILIWFGFSIFNALFSQRPYTHYVLVLIPSFCLLAGLLWHKKYRKIILIVLIVFLIFIQNSFYFYTKMLSYYLNFFHFIAFSKNVSDYRSFFDRQTPIDYMIADYLNNQAKNDDQIFIWGNNAQVYKMIEKTPPGRYTVAYHINANQKTVAETKNILQKNPPKYIIVMQNIKEPIPFVLPKYTLKKYFDKSAVYERSD